MKNLLMTVALLLSVNTMATLEGVEFKGVPICFDMAEQDMVSTYQYFCESEKEFTHESMCLELNKYARMSSVAELAHDRYCMNSEEINLK